MTISRKVPTAVVAFALLFGAGSARADDGTELESAKNAYDGGRFSEGAERLKELLNPGSPHALKSPGAIERARAYYAACLISLGRTQEANEQFEKLLRQNPQYKFDPVVFPRQVTDPFLQVRERMKNEIEAADRARADAREKADREQRAYIANLQKMASQETVIVPHSRWIAALPFGVGQFQNGQEGLGYAFLVTEVLLAGTSITAGVIDLNLISDYNRDPTAVDFGDFVSRKNATYDLNVYSTVAFALVALGGVAQAQIAFVPETREVRTRPLPAPPAVMPTVGAVDSGLLLGVQGRF